MKVVLFDSIQEAHVAASLERALRSAGHEVYNTGRFGSGYRFRDTDELVPVLAPHLERIYGLDPDLILVFRPASAPFPIVQALRGTGAVLVTWLSDDPVLFEHSYGPVVDLYDVVLHCGNEAVLRFYEERFRRPTGVNFPFWTDHAAFPAVYGRNRPTASVMFLGNVVGPLRQARYQQLAAMDRPVAIYGRVGADEAGLGRGYLDSEVEVVDAGSRTEVALSIPQFFRDHRGQPTWFPGLDELGYFDLPSRVIQYAAMGIPTVSVVPAGVSNPAYPELQVCGSIQEADRWIDDAVRTGTLPDLSLRTLERFDRSFSADARVRALESLMSNDDWRSLDASERTTWFLQFDGRPAGPPVADAVGGPDEPACLAVRSVPEADAASGDVVLVHGRSPERFSTVDVLQRELRAWGRQTVTRGAGDAVLRPAPAGSALQWTVDVPALLQARAHQDHWFLVLADGVGIAEQDVGTLRENGALTVCLLGSERMSSAEAAHYDLVVRVGPAPVDAVAILADLPHVLRSPGLVESAFIDRVRGLDGRDGACVVRTGPDSVSDWTLDSVTGRRDTVSPHDMAIAPVENLADALAWPLVYLQPALYGRRRRQGHPPLTPYAVCAAPTVLTTRHASFRDHDHYGPWLVKAASGAEAETKLGIRSQALAGEGPEARLERRRRAFDARRQLSTWFEQARRLAGRESTETPAQVLGTAASLPLRVGRRQELEPELGHVTPTEDLWITLELADPGLVAGLRVHDGTRLLAESRFPAGTARALDIVLTGSRDAAAGPLSVELLGDPRHRLHGVATVRVRLHAQRHQRPPGEPSGGTVTAFVLPVPVDPAPVTASPPGEGA